MSSPSDQMACAVCAGLLERYQGRWIHGVEVFGQADHVAVPVPMNQVQVQPVCDFCHEQVTMAGVWTVEANSFQIMILTEKGPIPGYGSEGDWAACDVCVPMVRKNDWSGLIERYFVLHPDRATEFHRSMLTTWFDGLEKNLIRVRDERGA